jgi:F0F1-type ATP synthase membrane subunit b/b'
VAWFEKEMDYARESLEKVSERTIEHAAVQLNETVRAGLGQASQELREIVSGASREVDAKLDKISEELHSQRQFTKSDVKELVDYAAEKLGATIDARVQVMKQEITNLVQEKVEYFKDEVDGFFVKRQQDLARERRRLIANIFIAVAAAFVMGWVSLMYHRVLGGTMDMFGVFRAVFVALAGGYAVYVVVAWLRSYRQMSEHRKDLMFVTMKYWGVLKPESLFGHLVLILFLLGLYAVIFYPDVVAQLTGSEALVHWVSGLRGGK